ncbi:InlB B-repeat-containing protein [Candidatus Saccharibacteria bacterium]|nr:InlB B-repeat-containing protein [Candidatus Saccharibacteria bacterium]
MVKKENKKISFTMQTVFSPTLFVLALLSFAFLSSTLLFSNSAYATFSIGISSSGTVDLGTIMPTPTSGALSSSGTDNVLITTNCSAGYNVYATGSSGGSTALLDSKHNNTIPTSANTISSPNLLLTNTWGLNTNVVEAANGSYYGLPAYNADISSISPIYTASSSLEPGTRNDAIPVYYGIKVDMNTIPGNYSTNVLYTAIMNDVCAKYTLKFDDNSATENNLTDQTIAFGDNVNLSTYSTEAMIKRTGYHLIGWKVKIGNTISTNTLPTNNNTSIDDGESSEITLIAQWEVNTYNISYQIGSTGANNCTATSTLATYNQDVTLSSTKCTKTGYNQDGWSINVNGSTKDYTLGQTLTPPASNLTAENNGAYILYPHFTINSHTVTINKGSNVSTVSGAGSYNYDTTVSISATVSTAGYYFSSWTVNSGGVSLDSATSASTSFKMPDADVTITANADPNTFTLNYDANGGTGTTASQTVTYGTNVTLRSSGFNAPADKKFKQWGTTTTGGTAYSPSQSVAPADLKSNVTTTNGGTVTLYAIWEDDIEYFQTTGSCATIAKGGSGTLRDKRDNQDYTVYRWADSSSPSGMTNYCIMTKDLSLGYVTGGSITKGTNLKLDTTDSAAEGTITARTTSNWSTANTDTNFQYINGPRSGYEAHTSHPYYSWGAAKVVCPKGWRLPTKNEFDKIGTFVGGNNSTGGKTIMSAPYNLTRGGYFISSGWSGGSAIAGTQGTYWSSVSERTTAAWALVATNGAIFTVGGNTGKNQGRPVRCISEP